MKQSYAVEMDREVQPSLTVHRCCELKERLYTSKFLRKRNSYIVRVVMT